MDIDMKEIDRQRSMLRELFNEAAQVTETREEMLEILGKAGIEKIWNTDELQEDFDVLSFAAPFCIVQRKSDGQKGSLCFSHYPRWYFDFQPMEE